MKIENQHHNKRTVCYMSVQKIVQFHYYFFNHNRSENMIKDKPFYIFNLKIDFFSDWVVL